MNHPWVICLAREDASSLAGLRQFSGIEVGEAPAEIWLRGQGSDDRMTSKLAALPAVARYEWQPPSQLRSLGHRIPGGALPQVQWHPLTQWLQVGISALALPGDTPTPVALQLVRSTRELESELLLIDLPALVSFVATAPLVRLARLQYAVDENGHVLVRGRPLPPLSGRRFVLHSGVAVPAGFSWEPAVGVDVLERCFEATGGVLVVWNEDGTIMRLHNEQFVPLTRSGLREVQIK